MNILLLYPNVNGQPQIQMGLASLSAVLKRVGYKVDLFDTTFVVQGSFEEVSAKFVSKYDEILADFNKRIDEFKPDIFLAGIRSLEFDFATKLIRDSKTDIPVIFGGQHPSVSPEEVIKSDVVDYLCVGEGEEAILELLEKMQTNGDVTNIPNIWAKKDGKVYRNPVRPLMKNLDELPFPDWDIFDARHVGTRGSFETSRGCPYSCTYCHNDHMQSLYGGVGGFHREKSIKRTIEEMEAYVKKFPQVNYIWLIDETFTLKTPRVKEFCEQFKERIKDKYGVKFGCMTRPEALSQEKVDYLKMAECVEIAMGIESGNEKYRREMLDRQMPQQSIINAFLMAHKAGIKTYSFNMVGFPNETRKDIFSTIDLNRKGKVDEVQVTIFYPFKGTRLREFCENHGMLDSSSEKEVASYYENPVIKNPNLSKEETAGLFRTFVIYCKTPKVFWPIVRLMEYDNPVSTNMARVANTFIKQGFKPRTFKILFSHAYNNVLKLPELFGRPTKPAST
jgi:anaerobic magnesium-protoporphyrin IX monomethyl ester cyclase